MARRWSAEVTAVDQRRRRRRRRASAGHGRLVQLLGSPIITIANALLTAQLGFVESSLLFIPALTLTLSSGYLSFLGVVTELGLGRIAPQGARARTSC